MSEEKVPKPKDTVKLDVETILQTTEGRSFLNQLNEVSRVLSMRDSAVYFKGEKILKTGYLGDCKSVQLFKCPNGYFLFCNKAFTKNNWSAAGSKLNDVIEKIQDREVKKKISEAMASALQTN